MKDPTYDYTEKQLRSMTFRQFITEQNKYNSVNAPDVMAMSVNPADWPSHLKLQWRDNGFHVAQWIVKVEYAFHAYIPSVELVT
jgi:hypothetical protein